ncbi:apoptosis-inducing factor 3-like [Puma concolor]|uniref:Apoptosis-inducing factor 3-like n=1 Tax=Puma concolor TaxID=9696 RepID=A0A6P6IN89_PUMCO|nr:apoptosis-inducing factor 3-like [Puma concolor]
MAQPIAHTQLQRRHLAQSVLSRGRVRCPWHGACFNIGTGDLEDFPGLDSLHKFQVKIEKEKVYVRASKQALQLQRRTKVMAKCISPSAGHSSSTNVLIVGAGAAGLVCAETLRQEGFSDRIVLCTLDRHLPYDRPKLSKSLDAQPEQLALRPKEFFRAYGIEVLTEAQVVTVDVRNKKVVFKDGFKLEYSKLLLAPGSSPKMLSCKGKEVENVFTIRTPEDANRVVRLARGRNAVVVGAGFLGMEVAAYLTEKAHSVSVVELEETPFRRFLGERVGRALMKMFENNRVKFYMQTEVSELRAQEGKLKEVVLKSSKVVRADVCVVGIGAVPATGFLRQSSINLDSRGFIPVNKDSAGGQLLAPTQRTSPPPPPPSRFLRFSLHSTFRGALGREGRRLPPGPTAASRRGEWRGRVGRVWRTQWRWSPEPVRKAENRSLGDAAAPEYVLQPGFEPRTPGSTRQNIDHSPLAQDFGELEAQE